MITSMNSNPEKLFRLNSAIIHIWTKICKTAKSARKTKDKNSVDRSEVSKSAKHSKERKKSSKKIAKSIVVGVAIYKSNTINSNLSVIIGQAKCKQFCNSNRQQIELQSLNMTRSVLLCVVVIAVSTGFVHSNPAKFWNGTPVDGLVSEMRSMCNDENDSFSCMKLKVMNFLDNLVKKDNYKITEDVEVRHNGYAPVNEQRSEKDILEKAEDYVQSHDVTVNVPVIGAKVTLSPKSLDQDELNFSVKFSNGARSAVEGKCKLIQIFPLIFLLTF